MSQPPNQYSRFASLDWMRGLVMVLMVLDHASLVYNGDRIALDSAATYTAGTPLPVLQFLTRWVTHICAPTFIFLAGAVLALSCQRRVESGESSQSITRSIVTRGLIIAALDIVWMSPLIANRLVLQVLFAIGVGMVAMAWLRTLSNVTLVMVATGWFLIGEILTLHYWEPGVANPPVAAALMIAPFYSQNLTIIYPAIPWLAVMILGWVFGRYLAATVRYPNRSVIRLLVITGAASIAVFLVVRGLNGYGNMLLFREDNSLVHWLHVSKYPPSLSFIALELGLMSFCLAALMWLERHIRPRSDNPLLLFGQTALFFYLLHIIVLGIPAILFALLGKGSLLWAYVAAPTALLVLYPICRVYRRYKWTHPDSWTRYI